MSEFCSEISTASAETLYATSFVSSVWVLLEYRQPWRPQAPADNDLPDDIKAWLDAQLAAVDGELQFIRQLGRDAAPLALYVAVVDDVAPVTYGFELESYVDLLALDLPDIVRRAPRYDGAIETEPLTFVCTHGKRDRCCALYGMGLYHALTELMGDRVWQTTHLSGHRFAPTLLTLPDGLTYGRVHLDSAEALVEAQQSGDMLVDLVRGRVCYDKPTQAAEAFVRQQTGLTAVAALRHLSTQATETGWQVVFSAEGDHLRYTVNVAAGEPLVVQPSCGVDTRKTVPQFHFESLTTSTP